MILGGALTNVAVFSNAYLISSRQYNQLNIYGSAVVDKVQMINEEEDESAILSSLSSSTQIASIPDKTIIFSEFDNNLQAGQLYDYNSPVTAWYIYRREKNALTNEWEPITKFIGIANSGSTNYIDYTIQNKAKYKYEIVPQIYEYLGQYLETNEFVADVYGWYLMEVDEASGQVTVYRFDIQITSSDIAHNTNYTMYQNYTEFPTFNQLKTDFKSGTISFMPIYNFTYNGVEPYQPAKLIEVIEKFINDRKTKILKNTKGEIMKVHTHDFNYKYNDIIEAQPAICTFAYTQTGRV